jgi:hypothetical protein
MGEGMISIIIDGAIIPPLAASVFGKTGTPKECCFGQLKNLK